MSKKRSSGRSDDQWVGSFAGKPSLAMQPARRRKPIPTPVLLLAIVMLIVSLFALMFLTGYLNAEDVVEEYLVSNDLVTVSKGDGAHVFSPAGETPTTGLIFYPGAKVEHDAYAPLMQMIAEQGYFCVLVEMPLRMAAFEPSAAAHFIGEYPAIEQWYVGGHSLGGAMAARFLADNPDAAEGLLLLAAYSDKDLSATDLRVLSVTADQDKVMDREEYETCKANLPASFEEHEITGGNHAGFGSYGDQDDDGWAEIESLEQQRITADLVAGWLKGE
ncbi:MAG: hypothetical protein IJC43_10065 [Clostridia bacterium]|nr:hypothetical protein [Clostridia bacterium]